MAEIPCLTVVSSFLGRTGRIGHRGLATSFFTEADEPIASVLTRTLLETNQDIPDFLQPYLPEEGEILRFEADSDFEPDDAQDGDDDDGWGGPADPANAGDDGWN